MSFSRILEGRDLSISPERESRPPIHLEDRDHRADVAVRRVRVPAESEERA